MRPDLPSRHIAWFLWVAFILKTVLLLSGTAAALEQADLNVTRYLGQLQVKREETWLRRVIREFRTYPHLDRAYRLMENDRLAEARAELEQYLTIDPRDLRVRTTYLILLHRVKEYAEVIRQADRVLQEYPRFVPALLYRGMAHQSLDRLDEAIEDFKAASAVADIEEADRVFALNMVADLAIRRQLYADALSVLQQLAGTAKDFSLRLRQGIALEGLNRFVEADGAYRHALALARDAGERLRAYRALGEVAKKRRDWESARQAFLSALELEPQNPELMRALGEVAYARKDYPETAHWIRQALALRPDLKDREFLAHVLYALKDYRAAAEEFTRLLPALETRKDRYRVYMALGNAYTGEGRFAQAAEAFRQAIQLQDDLPALMALAHALERQGRLAEAIQQLQRALERQPTAEVHLRLGILYAKTGEHDNALRHLEEASRGDLPPPLRATADAQRGFIFYKLGRHADARKALETALAMTPKDPSLYVALGETYIKLGAIGDAIRYLKQGLALQETPEGWRALALAQIEAGQVSEAIAVYRQLLKGLPQRSDTAQDLLASIANLEVKRGNPSEAATLFLEAFERGGASSWTLLAQAAQSLVLAERWEEAARANLHLLDLTRVSAEGKAEALENLGFIYIKLDQYPLAADYFRKAINAGRDGWRLRQNLGLTLYKMKQWNEALEHFGIALEQKRSPLSMAYVGRTYKELSRPGVAIHYMRVALSESEADQLDKAEQRDLYNGLGYLYADEAQYARAAEVWTRSLALQYDPVIALRLGNMQRLLGRVDEAQKGLEGIDPAALPPQLQTERFDALASIYRQRGQFGKAIDALTSANTVEAVAHRYYLLGLDYRSAMRPEESLPHFREAVARDPNNTLYATALGYAYKDVNRFGEAARLFERVIELDPDYLPLYKDLGYLYMREVNNDRAVHWFRLAIDNEPLYPTHSRQEEEELHSDIYRMRTEVTKITTRYDFTAYLSYTTIKRRQTVGPGLVGGGAIPSQGGVQFAYQPPVLGFRDERIFQVFARLLWDIRPRSLDFDSDSYQGGVGIRYKPLRTQNLYVSAERLFKIGDRSDDNWLLRTLYSWDYGYDLRPGKPRWNYTFLFGDVAYFVRNPRTTYYVEARQGITFNLRDTLLVTPHLILDGRYQDPHRTGSSYLEGGIGLSFKYLFNETRYEAHRSSFELLIHYKKGSFLKQGLKVSGDAFDGLIVTGVLQF